MFGTAKESFFKTRQSLGVKENTLKSYGEALDQLFGFVLARKPLAQLQDIDRDDIEDYLMHLRNLGRMPYTVQNRFRTLRCFFRWCKEAGLIEEIPLKGIGTPRVPKYTVHPHTTEEMMGMLAASGECPTALRDHTLIQFMWSTGLRLHEVAKFRKSDIAGDEILVAGKGSKERTVGLDDSTRIKLEAWMVGKGSGPVFNLTGSGIYQRVRQLGEAAGVKNPRPHRIRHAFAIHFLANGGSIRNLMEVLGHESIETTMRYAHYIDKQQAASEQRRVAPMAMMAVA